MNLTKSKYVQFLSCKRKAWLDLFYPIAQEQSDRAIQGVKIGLLAHKLLGDTIIIKPNETNPPSKPGIYAEYPFIYNNLLCLVDLLKINEDGSIDIFEVKSTKSPLKSNGNLKEKYLNDIAFQYYVATKLNKVINTVNLVTLDGDYIYDGISLDLNKLFKITDYKHLLVNKILEVEKNINEYFKLNINDEIKCHFSSKCSDLDTCQYLQKCKDYYNLKGKLDLYTLFKSKTNKYTDKGFTCIEDIYNDTDEYESLNSFMQMVINYNVNNIETPYVNKKELNEFLDKLEFPLYFFDFESTQLYVPEYKNSRPIQHIPFQYSLHIMNDKKDCFKDVMNNHKEFLGDGVNDPREDLIKQMILDLKDKGTIIAYHDSFEGTIISDLIRDFPSYKEELTNISNRFVDLRIPFASKVVESIDPITFKKIKETKIMVYQKNMGKRSSIKLTLPALFPDDPEYNYSNLEQVHNGSEAMFAYQKLATLPLKEKEILRENMLKYCCLDTKAMVALYFKLVELAK